MPMVTFRVSVGGGGLVPSLPEPLQAASMPTQRTASAKALTRSVWTRQAWKILKSYPWRRSAVDLGGLPFVRTVLLDEHGTAWAGQRFAGNHLPGRRGHHVVRCRHVGQTWVVLSTFRSWTQSGGYSRVLLRLAQCVPFLLALLVV